jgi:hypothetical protein
MRAVAGARAGAARGNLRCGLPRRARVAGGLDAYDRLPAPLRRWLAQAVLPWSVRSARRLWQRALAESGGDVARALARLDEAEARQLARESCL